MVIVPPGAYFLLSKLVPFLLSYSIDSFESSYWKFTFLLLFGLLSHPFILPNSYSTQNSFFSLIPCFPGFDSLSGNPEQNLYSESWYFHYSDVLNRFCPTMLMVSFFRLYSSWHSFILSFRFCLLQTLPLSALWKVFQAALSFLSANPLIIYSSVLFLLFITKAFYLTIQLFAAVPNPPATNIDTNKTSLYYIRSASDWILSGIVFWIYLTHHIDNGYKFCPYAPNIA